MIAKISSWLKSLKTDLEKEGYPVQRMILFGSHARGDALKESDVDVIIVSPAFSSLSMPRRQMLLEELWKARKAIETLPYTPEEFERVKRRSYTIQEALRYGVEI